jgi:hypothetical protein
MSRVVVDDGEVVGERSRWTRRRWAVMTGSKPVVAALECISSGSLLVEVLGDLGPEGKIVGEGHFLGVEVEEGGYDGGDDVALAVRPAGLWGLSSGDD